MIKIAVIGFGGRLAGISNILCKQMKKAELVAIADPDLEGVKRRLKNIEIPEEGVSLFEDADQLLENVEKYDALLIGTRCNLHAPLAVKVASVGLPLFLEKPVAIDEGQLRDLACAYKGREKSVLVSFPLRATPVYKVVLDIVRSGRLGTINQIQAVNNVTYGGVYYGDFYRNYDEVGGLWLQKATHDFDYITDLADSSANSICAAMTQMIYKGDFPHDLKCSHCDQTEKCPESPENFAMRGHGGGMGMDDHWCAFSKEIKNQDAGSAIIEYQSGTIASYCQNFVVRNEAGRRGATIIGYKASVEFDWYSETIRVVDHFQSRVDNIKSKSFGGHGGGDSMMCRNFIEMVKGDSEPFAPLNDGVRSVAMCLAARKACHEKNYQQVPAYEEIISTG